MNATDDRSSPWPRDLLASVVVFLVALPLCMGIALASGVSPAAGLITGIVGGLIVGALAGSPLQVSGPAAGLAVIVYELVQAHGVAALGPIVLVAGLIQVAAGALGLGQWFRAVSPAVIHGMLAGIGVLIFAAQLHVMIDDRPRGSGLLNLVSIPDAVAKVVAPPADAPASHRPAALLGLVTLLVLVAWTPLSKRLGRVGKSLPAALVAVLAAVGLAAALRLDVRFVDVPGGLFAAIAVPSLDGLAGVARPQLLLEALALAVIASAESLLCATATDAMHKGPRTDYDKELRAQGVGNAVCGLLGALPLTGVIVRSTANIQAGAVSRRSAILHGAWLLVFAAALPAALALIPTAALAAVLVFTGYKLVNLAALRELRTHGRGEVAVYAATIVGVVAIDLLSGVLLGLALSAARVLLAATRLEVEVVPPDAGEEAHVVRLRGVATFLGIPRLARAFEGLPRGSHVRVDLDDLGWVDAACQDFLRAWGKRHAQDGGRLVLEWDVLKACADCVKTERPAPAETVRGG